MRNRIAVLAILLLAFAHPGAAASLDYAWNDCLADGGAEDIAFPCDQAGASVKLYASFVLDEPINDVVGFEFRLDYLVDDTDVPPFWRFQTAVTPAECNPGLAIHPDPGGACASHMAPLADDMGTVVFSTVDGSPGNGRIVGGVYQESFTSGINLVPGQRYFAFALEFFSDAAVEAGGSCTGCEMPVDFLQPRLDDPEKPTLSYPSSLRVDAQGGSFINLYVHQQCVTTDGGFGVCAPTPTRRSTWGLLKSLYR